MTRTRSLAVALTLVLATMTFSSSATAATSPYAPTDRPGPALTVPVSTLSAALQCSGDFAGSQLEPILLNPATGVTVDENYSWNYERAFTAQKRPWCAIHIPSHTLDDIQVSGEYIVSAIRTMYSMSHRKIAIMGHSQGGMSMRWALRFWPDTRPMVDDVIGMAGSNHGTTALPTCIVGVTQCMPAVWQQQAKAEFIKALNSGAETFEGISYTEIYTRTDEVVTPAASAGLTTGAGRITNVATQQVCPVSVYEHLTVGTIDPAAYALAMDALTHDGPAVPTRVNKSVCFTLYHPGVNPANLGMYLSLLAAAPGLGSVPLPNINLVGVPELPAEPALRCYTTSAGC